MMIRFKNSHRIPTVPMGIHHSSHTHPILIPMGIPIPTATLLSVCLSVCNVTYRDHTGWNTSKIISRPNNFRYLHTLTPTWAIWCNENTPKISVE